MDKTGVFGVVAAIFLLSVLFFPTGEKFAYWILIIGLIFGVAWFFRLN